MLALPGAARAQGPEVSGAEAGEAPEPALAKPGYRLVIEAPDKIKRMLERGLSIARWQDDAGMTEALLRRLVAESVPEATQALNAEGWFSPRIETSVEAAGGGTRKERSDLSWIMNNPWILSAPFKDSTGKRYYFSSRAGRFYYLGVKVFEPHREMIGFFLLKVRDDRMSVVYAFFDSRHSASITAAVFHHALAMDVSILSLYGKQLAAGYSELGCPCWAARKKSREFSLSKAFADIPLANCRLQGGDGDLAFY